ncbi:MAG: glycine cleavage system aminomethyltransferase GcvT [Chitinispirillaceae bacterium]|nr:glycine cleavage system aminomethyltransferase GcvT [Chitinispirillaceae bacterium]
MKKTILCDLHVALGAKMAPFGGYEMPIQYSGIIAEHRAARDAAVIFDTCHMGEFRITGENAAIDLETVLSCPVAALKIGQCRYGFLCNEKGGMIDDQIVYRMAEKEFFMVVNAATEPSDFDWIQKHLSSGTRIENLSAQTAKLDLQGPGSAKIMRELMALPIDGMKYYTWAKNRYRNTEILISRTGYTGEIGFEIYCSGDLGRAFWNDSLNCGVVPAGLGARDTLRLEMGYPLYGHELDERTNAAESNFVRAIDGSKKFIGSSAVLDPAAKRRLLAGIRLDGRRTARNGDAIVDTDGKPIGTVTSGSFSPSLGCAVALGYVLIIKAGVGSRVRIRTDRQELTGSVVELPFYKNATGRMDIKKFL